MARVEDHYLFRHSDNASVYKYDISLSCLLVDRKSRYVTLLW